MPAAPPQPPAIGAIMKREAPYILEWVAWHRLQGFDLIVADNCTDGPQTEMLRTLSTAGELVYIDARDLDSRPQLPAYERILAFARGEGRQVLGFLDTDEFFEPLGREPWGGAALVTAQLSRPLVDAVSFRWCIFGSNGETEAGDAPVVARFPRRGPSAHPQNQYVKSFARVDALTGPLFGPHVLPVPRWRYALEGRRFRAMKKRARPVGWTLARIRHYAVKSRAEFLAKRAKGDVFYAPGQKPADDRYWEDYDLNDVADPVGAEVLATLETGMAALAGRLGLGARA